MLPLAPNVSRRQSYESSLGSELTEKDFEKDLDSVLSDAGFDKEFPDPREDPDLDEIYSPMANHHDSGAFDTTFYGSTLRRESIGRRPTLDQTGGAKRGKPSGNLGNPDLLDREDYQLCKTAIRILTTPRPIPTREELKKCRRQWSFAKWAITGTQLLLNGFCIFGTWWWTKYYYVFLPMITLTVALNDIMLTSVIIHKIWRFFAPEKKYLPEKLETIVYVLPCYNESPEECTKSLDSLINQVGVDAHKSALLIVCDGRVRGHGMAKTCGDYLLEDILVHRESRFRLKNAYNSWDTLGMDVEIQTGEYKGLQYYCIIKDRNQGKRGSLIVARYFLYNFNRRHESPATIFMPEFFGYMCSFLTKTAGIHQVEYLIGMDADTVFDDRCVSYLLAESRYKNTVGVCGYVAVDFSANKWSPWSLYQSSEYTISQGLRRLHQSIATHKVSCLPGCCQLLRICEITCGDEVLLGLFGYYPRVTDNILKQIRATASEDRNHVCLMLSARPKAQTRQALRARAITDVPHSWSVFLSQRRRWTLGATSNDLYLMFAPGLQWFERILAISNVVTWYLNPFILGSIACFITACLSAPAWIILAFTSTMMAPVAYYICIAIWLPKTMTERLQYMMGLFVYIILGPFLNISVLGYALWNMDNFGWGKTRQVAKETDKVVSEKKAEIADAV